MAGHMQASSCLVFYVFADAHSIPKGPQGYGVGLLSAQDTRVSHMLHFWSFSASNNQSHVCKMLALPSVQSVVRG